MRKKRLQAGVIGSGMGRYHMEAYANHPDVDLVAVCDLNEAEAKVMADRFGAKHVFTDYLKMYELPLDLVSIATPNYLHAPMAIAALQAGMHVLTEKPMATTVADAKAMVAAARKAKKRLMVDMSLRFNPTHAAMKQMAASGRLGEIYFGRAGMLRRKSVPSLDFPVETATMGRGRWFVNRKQAGGGALMDIGVHTLDFTWWLMGQPQPVSAAAVTYAKLAPPRWKAAGIEADVDELAAALVRFEGGASIIFEVTWAGHQPGDWYVKIYGTEAGLCLNDKLGLYSEVEGYQAVTTPDTHGECESAYQHFVRAVQNPDLPMLACGEAGLAVVQMLCAINESATKGGEVRIGA